jgi:triacylglycerol lipase
VVIASLWLLVKAFKQSVWWGLGVLFFPPMSLVANDYMHCHREMALGGEASAGLARLVADLAGKAVAGVLSGSLARDFWAGITAHLDAHALEGYRQGMKDRFGW